MVSCEVKFQNVLYDACTWPSGTELESGCLKSNCSVKDQRIMSLSLSRIMASASFLSNLSNNIFVLCNGLIMFHELCCNHLIVAIQEHWFRNVNLDRLNLIH